MSIYIIEGIHPKYTWMKLMINAEKNCIYFNTVKVIYNYKMNRSARKTTLWTLRKVSARISLGMPRRLIQADTFLSCELSVSGSITLYLYPP